MKLLSLFSGIGAFEKALDNLKIPYELVGYCEIDKHASKSYSAIHNVSESMNFGDITKVDEKALPKDIDLITYGFPCQDISLAGKQKGLFNEDGTQTRSGLFFDALRIIKETQPRVAIAENVKNLVGKKFEKQFQIVLDSLEDAGYNNYWQVLNAKDYGIPQNRERVFIVSIRKDIDTGMFKFIDGFPLELRLKDMLEDVVDEKYYLSNKQMSSIVEWKAQQKPFERVLGNESISPTLTARGAGEYHSGMILYSPTNQETTNMQVQVCETMQIVGTNEPTIQRVDIPQTVKVRKYPIDNALLCWVLRHHKSLVGQTNNAIADALAVPLTKVEHWFRQDDCFAIPDADIWMKLKELLGIDTDEFDEAIMTFEEKEGVFEKAERHYLADGIAPTLTSASANEKIIVNEPKIEVVGNYSPSGHDASRIVDENGLAPTVKENHGTVTAVARYQEVIKEHNQNARHQQDLLQCATGICRTIPAGTHGSTPHLLKTVVNHSPLRIRKLTPKECFRLQGFSDLDFEKAEKVNSNTQLYKQAGNSICVPVVEYITKALIDCGALAIRKEQKEMELRVNDYQLPSPITFNYEEIKRELIEKVSMYETLVYTDEQIKDAKTDRANLNKLKKALNDERIRLEKEYMQPFNDTKAKFNEIISLIDKPVGVIDSQVKAYEEKQKEEKLQKIQEYIEETEKNLPDGVHIPVDCKWLNASVSMKSVQSEIDAKVEQIQNDLATLQNLPEFGFEATEVYKSTLDLNRALNEGKRLSEIAKAKAAHEAEMKARAEEQARLAEEKAKAVESMNVTQPTPVELNNNMSGEFVGEPLPAKQWVKFQAFMTVEQAMELKKFFDDRQIEFKSV